MLSLNRLFEFQGISDELANEAALRLHKYTSAGPMDVDAELYKTGENVKEMQSVVRGASDLSDRDKLGIWSGHGAKSPNGRAAHQLLQKRFQYYR
jgi:hypothetical protein